MNIRFWGYRKFQVLEHVPAVFRLHFLQLSSSHIDLLFWQIWHLLYVGRYAWMAIMQIRARALARFPILAFWPPPPGARCEGCVCLFSYAQSAFETTRKRQTPFENAQTGEKWRAPDSRSTKQPPALRHGALKVFGFTFFSLPINSLHLSWSRTTIKQTNNFLLASVRHSLCLSDK